VDKRKRLEITTSDGASGCAPHQARNSARYFLSLPSRNSIVHEELLRAIVSSRLEFAREFRALSRHAEMRPIRPKFHRFAIGGKRSQGTIVGENVGLPCRKTYLSGSNLEAHHASRYADIRRVIAANCRGRFRVQVARAAEEDREREGETELTNGFGRTRKKRSARGPRGSEPRGIRPRSSAAIESSLDRDPAHLADPLPRNLGDPSKRSSSWWRSGQPVADRAGLTERTDERRNDRLFLTRTARSTVGARERDGECPKLSWCQ